MVIASDGVWEFLDNNAVAKIVHPYYLANKPEEACNEILRISTEWWEKVSLCY